MRRFVTLDVFTQHALAGNPLAVVLDAEGLDTAAMQKIAGEFNLSETVFVLPPEEERHRARLRIFTPGRELPFAGHPTVGWPAKGSSRPGVKMRRRARCRASSGGSTNTVSDRLNSPAIACIAAVSSPSASSTTASGLPASARVVNTSRVTKRRGMRPPGGRLSGREKPARQ